MKTETLKHLTIVAKQINKTGAFEHFTKMVNANVNLISLQETLITKYNVNPTSLAYLYGGSDEQCVESSLLIAIRCDELRCKKLKIRINATTGEVHHSDYKKLNDENFPVYQEGNGYVDYKVGNNIIRKTFPTWLESGKANIAL